HSQRPLSASATSSSDAWTRLDRIFSKRSQSHIIHLKDKLSSIQRGTLHISDFLLQIKTLSDELSTLGAPLSDADLLIYCTRGLGPAYKEVIAVLRTRDTPVSFEELFDKLIDHETYLHDSDQSDALIFPSVHYTASSTQPQHLDVNRPSRGNTYVAPHRSSVSTIAPGLLPSPTTSPQSVPRQRYSNNFKSSTRDTRRNVIVCQYCSRSGHIATACWDLFPHLRPARPMVNVAHTAATSPSPQ
ncbi:hypothetical protein PHJA_000301900, partial [Phtheirospermum japonicum]